MDSLYQNPLVVATQKLTVPGQQADISCPAVICFKDPHIQQKINSTILKLVNSLLAMQIEQLIGQGYTELNLSITGWYEVKTNERGVLSLTLGNYTIAKPAAHGLTFIKSLTFDTFSGKVYTLSEEFKPGSDYVGKLSHIVSGQIKARNIALLDGFKGIKQEQDYYISDKMIVIYFQQYEITAYVYGLPMFPVSVYEIQDIIQPESPLDRMAAE